MKVQNPDGLEENMQVAKTGGSIAGDARKRIEKETGRPVINSNNAKAMESLVLNTIEAVNKIGEENE